MKILIFGNSHCGNFKSAFSALKSTNKKFLGKNIGECEFTFSSIIGPNFEEVVTSNDNSIIRVPTKLFRYRNGKKVSDTPLYETNVSKFNTTMFDVILWVQGENFFSLYHRFMGNHGAPALMTSSLSKIFINWCLKYNSHVYNIVKNNSNISFIYVGAPVRFYESKPEISPLRLIHEKFYFIHEKNLKLLTNPRYCSTNNLYFLGAPFNCLHPTGIYTYDKFARGNDIFHAGFDYWKNVVSQFNDPNLEEFLS